MENKHGLPEYIENSVYSAWKPNPLRLGITTLIDPPLIRTLKTEYWDKLEEDIADKLWMIHGNSLDAFIKQHSRWGLCNIKLEYEWGVDKDGNEIVVVAKPDYYNVLTRVLADLKDTSVWSVINGKVEYDQQLNSYDYLLSVLVPQLKIDKLELHAYCKDWKKNEKMRNGPNYPVIPFTVMDIPRWSREKQRQFIDDRVTDHLENPTRECTAREKWAKPEIFAAKKKANKTAKGGRLCDTRVQAQRFIDKQDKPGQWEIEHRPATTPRCNEYCSVNMFCPYYTKGK